MGVDAGGAGDVSILVLMDSRIKIVGTRSSDRRGKNVSILVLMDSRVKTARKHPIEHLL